MERPGDGIYSEMFINNTAGPFSRSSSAPSLFLTKGLHFTSHQRSKVLTISLR